MRLYTNFLLIFLIWSTSSIMAEELTVTEIKAEYHHGQTFITWKDIAEGKKGAKYRYSLYRSEMPITQENISKAELCYYGVLNNSAKQFGLGFSMAARLDPTKPTSKITEKSQPLPMWSGLAVKTVLKEGKSFYAIIATDVKMNQLSKIVPGKSALTKAISEKVAPIQPIKIKDSKVNGKYASSCVITGTKNLPLSLGLHGSQGRGGAAGPGGDLYIYFGTPEMGWRDGMPGIFSIMENKRKRPSLKLFIRDAIESHINSKAIETIWFGYACVPIGATHKEPRAYPFTENRVSWILNWCLKRYEADVNKVSSGGQSMGAMGSTQFSFHHPELFSSIYPRLGRIHQVKLPAAGPGAPKKLVHLSRWKKPFPMADGKEDYFTRMNSVKFASDHHEDLPFYGWCFGRKDTVASWSQQIEMVKVLTKNHHGFALSWNNHGHSSAGAKAMRRISRYYPSKKFAINKSYPTFGNSSINHNMGAGPRDEGDLVGGINLGFVWSDVIDQSNKWSVDLSNDLAKEKMTVDVTPRRCQKFKAKSGDKFKWKSSSGDSGEVVADKWGLITIYKFSLLPNKKTSLTIEKM